MRKHSLMAALTTLLVFSNGISAQAEELTPKRKAELIHMVKQDCGSCHGMTLKGGLGPTLLPQAMKKLPQAVINNTILFGRPGTAMPPWESLLTVQEASWISQQLQQGIETHDQSK